MIVVKLIGGLGNQMFQYAFGKSLSVKHQTELKLDTSFLLDRSPKDNFTFRDYELNVFKIDAAIAGAEEVKRFEAKGRGKKLLDLLALYFPFFSFKCYLREPYFQFFKKALDAPVNTYVDGYWQSEKYFKHIESKLREEFTPKVAVSLKTIQLAGEIKQNNSVSIHVRRSDYITNTHIHNYHGTCNEDYYYEAIKIVASKISTPKFYVFSDEPEWFKKNIKINFPVEYIEHNVGDKSYEDLYLMSLCRHNIIANSSFSWWGAWLNANTDKIVIGPANWFKDTSKNTQDLLPSTWIKI